MARRPARGLGLRILVIAALFARPGLAAPPGDVPTGAQVDRAVSRALQFLYTRQGPEGTWDTPAAGQHPGGAEALILAAALACGESLQRKPLAAALEHVGSVQPATVYARGLRTLVYARLGPDAEKARLVRDASWLLQVQSPRNGGWGYGPGHATTHQRPLWTDSSNTQLAILALRQAADAGANVPWASWKKAELFWRRSQNEDGGWGYEPPKRGGFRLQGSSYGSMTAAALASLASCLDHWASSREGAAHDGPPPAADAVDAGMKWLADHYTPAENPAFAWGKNPLYYYVYLHCLARAANRFGRRDLGGQDWAAELTRALLARQRRDGSWGGEEVKPGRDVLCTAFALWALAEARRPIAITKLALGPPWGQNFRDAARLTDRLGRLLARRIAWQQLAPDAPPSAFAEAPLLYVNPRVPDRDPAAVLSEQASLLRRFVLEGGTVLVQADGPAEAVVRSLLEAFEACGFRAGALPADHPAFALVVDVPADQRPEVIGIGDCCRTRIFVVTGDVSSAWHRGRWAERPGAFAWVANVLRYASGGGKLPGRLEARRARGRSPPEAIARLTVARLRTGRDWNANPLALDALDEVLRQAVSIGLRRAEPVDLGAKVPSEIAVLWLTGCEPIQLTATQRENLKRYLLGGGMLWADAATGSPEFTLSVREELRKMFGPERVSRLEADSPLIAGRFAGGAGADLRRVRYTEAAEQEKPHPGPAVLDGVRIRRRIAVVLSPYGVTCSLRNPPACDLRALRSADARRLAANVLLYAAARRPRPREPETSP